LTSIPSVSMALARNEGLMRSWPKTRVRFIGYPLFRDLLHAGIGKLGSHRIDIFVEWAIAGSPGTRGHWDQLALPARQC
jgi:hypothetical protein